MILNSNGIVLHSFRYGDKTEEHHGLLFVYYTEDELRNMVKSDFNLLKIQRYTEMKKMIQYICFYKKSDLQEKN